MDIDNRINGAIEHARITNLVKGGDRIVVVTGSAATTGTTNTMQIFTLEEEHSKLRFVGSSAEVCAPDAQSMVQKSDDNEEDIDALEEMRMLHESQNRRPRFSVMLSSKKTGFGGIGDIRLPL